MKKRLFEIGQQIKEWSNICDDSDILRECWQAFDKLMLDEADPKSFKIYIMGCFWGIHCA